MSRPNRTLSDRWIQAVRLWPLLVPLLILLPGLGAFPYPSPDAVYSDLNLAHYPYTLYFRQTLLETGRLPLWSPLILSGAPFAANPLAGLWYPPGWLALVLPLPLGFNLLILLHVLWGGLGMYRLARSEGLDHPPALLAALAFEAMPKLFAHYGAGHLTLLYALSWTPWLLLASATYPRSSGRSSGWLVSWEGPVLALIFLADVRWSLYAGLLWWGYALFACRSAAGSNGFSAALFRIGALTTQTLLAALLAAPLALPLLEFTRLSTRLWMSTQDVLAFSLPIPRLLGLVFPDFNGFHEYMAYAGQAALLLALLALVWVASRRTVRFWLAVWVLSLAFALGANLLPLRAAASLPLFDLLRVPARALFISGISIALLAAHALQQLAAGLSPKDRSRAGLLLTAYTGFLVALCLGIWFIAGELPVNFAWGAGFALLSAVYISLKLAGRLPDRLWIVGLLIICLIDWGVLNRTLFWPRSTELVLSEGQPLAEYLQDSARHGAGFRLYSPSYSMPQQTAARYRLQLADGVDPLQLQSYVELMQWATGVPWEGYSVTLPPFASGDPSSDNAAYSPDPVRLGWLNVGYVAAEYDLEVDGLELETRLGSTRLYRNRYALPRAWIQPGVNPDIETLRPAQLLEWSPDRIRVQASGPGRLVLAELTYPGWRVQVDGRPAQLETVVSLLRAVQVPEGEHIVDFYFRPSSLLLGLALCGAALLLGLAWARRRRRGRLE